jgi:hypothetical protein
MASLFSSFSKYPFTVLLSLLFLFQSTTDANLPTPNLQNFADPVSAVKQIHGVVDSLVDQHRYQAWMQTALLFPGTLSLFCGSSNAPLLLSPVPHNYDICKLPTNLGRLLFRFDPSIYPVLPGGWETTHNKSVYARITTELISQAHKHGGCTLIRNGSAYVDGKKAWAKVRCQCSIRYKRKKAPRTPGPLRKLSLTGDKKNERFNGRSGTRRTTTCRPVGSTAQCCPFCIKIGLDEYSFFLCTERSFPSLMHVGHARKSRQEMAPTKALFTRPVLEDQTLLAVANASTTTSSLYLNEKFGIRFSRHQIRYYSGLSSIASSLDSARRLSNKRRTYNIEMSAPDRMISVLEDRKATYIMLLHKADKSDPKGVVWSTTVHYVAGQRLVRNVLVSSSTDKDMLTYGCCCRASSGAQADQDVMIALAWCLPGEKRLVSAYPELMFVDGVCNVSNEGRPLVVFAVKTALGKTVPVIRAVSYVI